MPTVQPVGLRSRCGEGDGVWQDARKEAGHSNFQYVGEKFEYAQTIQRIFSLARKLGFQSFYVEQINPSTPTLLEEADALQRRCPDYLSSEVSRISFFTSETQCPSQESFLGYLVVKKDFFKSSNPIVHVYESVLKSYRSEAQNNFLRAKRKYCISFPFGNFEVEGVLYAQQNDRTFVCAHVALRTVLSLILPQGDISYTEMNRLAGVDHISRKVGEGIGGLNPQQLETIFSANNIKSRKKVHEPKSDVFSEDYAADLYGYIESGCPALLAFETSRSRHVVPVLGHTFNEDTWVSDARRGYFGSMRYLSSEGWLSTYLIHDDNFGPYLCISRGYLTMENFRLLYGLDMSIDALCFEKTEVVVLDLLRKFTQMVPTIPGNLWYNIFSSFARKDMLVLRAYMVNKNDYLWHSRLEQQYKDQVKQLLPDTFWMVEISCQELFSATRAKFGEVLLSCASVDENFVGCAQPLAFRLPGIVYFEGDPLTKVTRISEYTPLLTQ